MSEFNLKRRRHRNRRRCNRRQVIVVSLCMAIFVFILGTAYSAFSTNLNINASGEVIQPEYVSIGGNDVEVVSSGDGLYVDSYESGRYIYRGGDPNDYILLGDELYRIIAKEADGTYKVIRNSSLGSMVFDPGYSTAIDDDILTTDWGSVVGTRYSSSEDDYCYQSEELVTDYNGCGIWGSSSTMLDSNGENITMMPWTVGGDEKYLPENEAYLNLYLNQTYYDSLNSATQNIITIHYFNVGLVPYTSLTIEEGVEQEQAYKWLGMIGLASTTDYVRASNDSFCSSVAIYSYSNGSSDCYSYSSIYNWMYSGNHWWLITKLSDEGYGGHGEWSVLAEGALHGYQPYSKGNIRPVMYLSASIIVDSDSVGSEDNPYKIIS